MNKAIIIGRLTKDPAVRCTQSGKAVASFTVAVDRPYKGAGGKKEADFLPVIVWDKQGEACGEYLAKGRLVGVEGRIQARSYDAQDGSRRYVTEIVAEHVEFLSPKSERERGEYGTPVGEEEIPF